MRMVRCRVWGKVGLDKEERMANITIFGVHFHFSLFSLGGSHFDFGRKSVEPAAVADQCELPVVIVPCMRCADGNLYRLPKAGSKQGLTLYKSRPGSYE